MNRRDMLRRLKKGESPLEISILKWEQIASGHGRNLGTDNCALCETYIGLHFVKGHCKGCPVEQKTGRKECAGTPYSDFDNEITPEARRRCALKELEFLKSLRDLPPVETAFTKMLKESRKHGVNFNFCTQRIDDGAKTQNSKQM